jgi:hypothetical protein
VSGIFRTGDKAPCSGIYKTVHGTPHGEPHYVTALFGDTFPVCVECSDQVRFELAVSSVHINAHPYFNRGG